MALRHVILGLLMECPAHAYRLKELMSPAMPREKQLNDGVLYPLLSKMEREGLLKKKKEKEKNFPDRYVLYTTAKGNETFLAWLKGDEDEEDSVTYDFLAGQPFLRKFMFFRHLSRGDVEKKIAAQKIHAEEKLKTLQGIRNRMTERKVDARRIAILDLGIAQHKEKIRWLGRMKRTFKGGKR